MKDELERVEDSAAEAAGDEQVRDAAGGQQATGEAEAGAGSAEVNHAGGEAEATGATEATEAPDATEAPAGETRPESNGAAPAQTTTGGDAASGDTAPADGGTPPNTFDPARRAAQMAERPPRRVRHGLKLRGREEPRVESEIARRWLDRVMAGVNDAEEANEGLRYARVGQTTSLELVAGGVQARVQGHRGSPYRVTIPVATWPIDVRDAVVTTLAGEAASLAALLDRRLPEGLDEMLASLDLELIPSVFEPECECSRPQTCRHIAAVGMLVAERVQEDPVLTLAMRDLPAERLLDRLRQQRALESRGLVTAHPEPDVPEAREEAAALGEAAAAFWRPSARRAELAAGLPRDEQDHALLRRLGASPLGGQFPLVGLLASIYDAVREEVRRGEAEAEAWSGEDLDADETAEAELGEGDAAMAPSGDESTGGSDEAAPAAAEASPARAVPKAAKARAIGKAKPRAKAKARPKPADDDGDGAEA